MSATTDQIVSVLNGLFPQDWTAEQSQASPPTGVYGALLDAIAAELAVPGNSLLSSGTALLRPQLRLATMTGSALDQAAQDFYGPSLPRAAGEPDASYLARIESGLFVQRITRSAIAAILKGITGIEPIMTDSMRPSDVGGWGDGTASGCVAGGWDAYDTKLAAFTPGISEFRWSGPGLDPTGRAGTAWQGFIVTTWPAGAGAQGNPVVAWDDGAFVSVSGMWGWDSYDTLLDSAAGFNAAWWSGFMNGQPSASAGPNALNPPDAGQAIVLSAVDAARAAGVICWVAFLPAMEI